MSQVQEDQERKAPMTAAERKRVQRERDKSRGYTEIMVRVPVDRIDEARAYCMKLKPGRGQKKKSRDTSQAQTDIEDFIGNRDMSPKLAVV